MNKFALSIALAVSLGSTAASAAPVEMSEAEMDRIVAGKQTMTLWTDGTFYTLRPSRKGAPDGSWTDTGTTCISGKECAALWKANPGWQEF